MRLLKYLTEKYLTRFKSQYEGGVSFEVFINPSQKELREFDAVRFIANNETKKVYVWGAHYEIHAVIWEKLGFSSSNIYNSKDVLSGTTIKKGGKHETKYSDAMKKHHLSVDWEWVNKYIDVTKFIEKIRGIFVK